MSQVCALKLVLLELYPLIRQSFIWHHLNNEMVKERVYVRSSELDKGLLSNDNPIGVGVDTTTSKPSSSSQPKPFHALDENCVLKEKHIRRFKKRFQFSSKTNIHLSRPNEKDYAFAHTEVCFYEPSFLCGFHFPIHPFILKLLDHMKVTPNQLVPNSWRTILSCMSIWIAVHERDTVKIDEFFHLYHLPSTHCRIVREYPSSFRDWKSRYFFISAKG